MANQLFGPSNPAHDAGYPDPPGRKGFFTDTSIRAAVTCQCSYMERCYLH